MPLTSWREIRHGYYWMGDISERFQADHVNGITAG
jgi:hypothetical protein